MSGEPIPQDFRRRELLEDVLKEVSDPVHKRLMQHALYHQGQIDYIRPMGEEGWGRGRTYWEEAADALSACP